MCIRDSTSAPAASVPAGEKTLTYYACWTESEVQAEVLKHTIERFETDTGYAVNVQWIGRDINKTVGVADVYKRQVRRRSRLLILLRAAAETWISARLEATIKSRTILRPHRRTLPSPRRRARATEPLLHSGAGSAFRALPV